mgnify:CR=1 FL=1
MKNASKFTAAIKSTLDFLGHDLDSASDCVVGQDETGQQSDKLGLEEGSLVWRGVAVVQVEQGLRLEVKHGDVVAARAGLAQLLGPRNLNRNK